MNTSRNTTGNSSNSHPDVRTGGSRKVDVFVAGAGPAGLACAIALSMRGLTVEMADGMTPPIDKACGEGLLPGTLATLAELGIPLHDGGNSPCSPVRGIRFFNRSNVSAEESTAQAVFPHGTGLGVGRTVLHQLLLDRALALGVRIHWKTVVRDLVQSPDATTILTNGPTVRARFVAGADGHQSRIRALAGLDHGHTASRRFGLRQHFAIAPWTDFVEVYWSDRGQAYVTPIDNGHVCVAFLSRNRFTGIEDALIHFPQLRASLASAQPSGAPRGAITLHRRLHCVTQGKVALIGDASGSIDAITGQGLTLCFSQALALAAALHRDDLSAYQRHHAQIYRLPSLMSRAMLHLDRSFRHRNFAITAFQQHPALFAYLLRIHADAKSPSFRHTPPVTSSTRFTPQRLSL